MTVDADKNNTFHWLFKPFDSFTAVYYIAACWRVPIARSLPFPVQDQKEPVKMMLLNSQFLLWVIIGEAGITILFILYVFEQ